eukprot:COSAG04_NODE_31_length_35649_cov_21.693052_17_plen_241_part_00
MLASSPTRKSHCAGPVTSPPPIPRACTCYLLDRISPIFPPFFPIFCAFSPSRRGGSNKPQAIPLPATRTPELRCSSAAVAPCTQSVGEFTEVNAQFGLLTDTPQPAARALSLSAPSLAAGCSGLARSIPVTGGSLEAYSCLRSMICRRSTTVPDLLRRKPAGARRRGRMPASACLSFRRGRMPVNFSSTYMHQYGTGTDWYGTQPAQAHRRRRPANHVHIVPAWGGWQRVAPSHRRCGSG